MYDSFVLPKIVNPSGATAEEGGSKEDVSITLDRTSLKKCNENFVLPKNVDTTAADIGTAVSDQRPSIVSPKARANDSSQKDIVIPVADDNEGKNENVNAFEGKKSLRKTKRFSCKLLSPYHSCKKCNENYLAGYGAALQDHGLQVRQTGAEYDELPHLVHAKFGSELQSYVKC